MTEEYKLLNPKCKVAMYILYSMIYAILFLIIFGILFLSDITDYSFEFDLLVTFLLLLPLLIYFIVAPQIFFRHYKYIITPDKIDVLRGIIIIRRTVVPIERIHQVEVTRGPINNMLKLADVDVTTAGGVATIQFLDIPVANNVAEELNRYINTIVRDRKENE
jgi:Uncharacterized conserved protein